jgi:4-hydroxy-tetrahydrodipicolinate synthase
MVVYNIAGRTGKNIENPVMLELAKHPRIRAVKEASGDINQMMDLIAAKPADFSVLSGDDNLVFSLMALGGTGVISVASNIVPDRMVAMVGALLKGDVAAARRMHYELLPLFRAMFIETNPIPVKAALAMKGLITETYRLPMCPLAPKSREKLAAVLKDLRVV